MGKKDREKKKKVWGDLGTPRKQNFQVGAGSGQEHDVRHFGQGPPSAAKEDPATRKKPWLSITTKRRQLLRELPGSPWRKTRCGAGGGGGGT